MNNLKLILELIEKHNDIFKVREYRTDILSVQIVNSKLGFLKWQVATLSGQVFYKDFVDDVACTRSEFFEALPKEAKKVFAFNLDLFT